MKIRPISDIHLEFGSFELPVIKREKNQVLCIMGDLNPSRCLLTVDKADKSTETFFESLKGRFKDILYISGNHEYYHGDVALDDNVFKDFSENFGVTFLQGGDIKIIDEVTFIGATLWTDFDNQNERTMKDAGYMMNDYHAIKDSDALDKDSIDDSSYIFNIPRFSPDRALLKHYKHRAAIFEEIKIAKIKDPKAKTVVMTHHAPHEKSIHEHYRSNGLNGAYYSDLEHELTLNGPDLWMHGHVHCNFDYKVADTRIICNPRGYNKYEENPDFNPKMVIEV